jgi:NAD(P)-dependent dehydrogenase (short-subunit alcohol dehydrogenase family)
MKNVVVTGSTRGIGLGLARAFVERGCAVTVSGREQGAVDRAVAELATESATARVHGWPCDVARVEQVQALWDAAVRRFGRVDLWVNNAGVGVARAPIWEQPAERVDSVVTTNVIGAIHGSSVALRGMLGQGSGALYNMEGLGSDGRQVAGLAVYGCTKAALRYLDRALVREVQGTPVIVGIVSPGMVITDMILDPYRGKPAEWAAARKIFNILADRVETVCPWLVDRMLGNTRNGAHFNWLSGGKAALRFALAPLRRRDLFAGLQGLPE